MSQEYNEYRSLLKKSSFIEASRFAELQHLKSDINNPFWLTRQAAALTRAKKFNQALEIAKQALSLDPSNPYSVLAVAEAMQGLNRHEEAIRYFEEITENPKLSFYGRKGVFNSLLLLKKWDRVLKLLTRWEMPADTVFRWKVKALEGKKRFDEAIEVCRQWLKADPDNHLGLWSLIGLEIRQDGLEQVLSRMGKIAKIKSRPPIYKEIYASLCKRAGKHELALKQYDKISVSGSNTWNIKQRAFALAKSGKEAQAVGLMEELLKTDPTDYFIHKSYKAACGRLNQPDRVLIFYENLLELHPEEKTLFGRIGKVKKELGIKE